MDDRSDDEVSARPTGLDTAGAGSMRAYPRRPMSARRYIRHPSELPIRYSFAPTRCARASRLKDLGRGGIRFQSDESVKPGTAMKVIIPVLDADHELHGWAAWSRRVGDQFETGMAFATEEDAFLARMVEQVCHIEAYRRRVRVREGRRLSSEGAAKEWIEKFAAEFP